MGDFSGRVVFEAAGQGATADRPCSVCWDAERLTIVPSPGPPIAFDLGDVDRLVDAGRELMLDVWPGHRVRLSGFHRVHERVAHELRGAYRDRLVRCLLLADLPELDRFPAWAALEGSTPSAAKPAEVRLYETNLAVLPADAAAFHWRLADLDDLAFDERAYAWTLVSGGSRLVISRLAKRTAEFGAAVRQASEGVARRGMDALSRLFPFLDAATMATVAGSWREGRAIPVTALDRLDRRLVAALMSAAVSAALRDYVDDLMRRSSGRAHVGFLLRRPEPDGDDGPSDEDPGEDGPAAAGTAPLSARGTAGRSGDDPGAVEPVFWFLFALPSPRLSGAPDLVAWETASASGRATYLFDGRPGLAALNRGLVALNFRREPIYLPDDRLAADARFRRHAIAARRLPDLRALRAAFAGRVIHSSLDAWRAGLEGIVASPRGGASWN